MTYLRPVPSRRLPRHKWIALPALVAAALLGA